MSARYKYIVPAVAGIALLGGAAAFTYLSNTKPDTASVAFEEGTPDATETSVDLAATDATAVPAPNVTVAESGLEDTASVNGAITETSINGQTADNGETIETPIEIVIDTAPAEDRAAAPVASETLPE